LLSCSNGLASAPSLASTRQGAENRIKLAIKLVIGRANALERAGLAGCSPLYDGPERPLGLQEKSRMSLDTDPSAAVLDQIESDLELRPEIIRPVPVTAVSRARELVRGVEVDLEASLD
jgi:hypothetical protein